MEAGGPQRRQRNQSGYRYSRIVFTLNNWTALEYSSLTQWTPTWLVIGKEVGEDGTPHLQGAAILGKQMTLAGLKKIPGLARAHIEPMMGTPQHNLVYCTKQDGAAFQFGTMPAPGKRNDLQEAYLSLREGSTMKQLALHHGVEVIKYAKGLTICRSLLAKPRTRPPKIIWLFGPTGVGKTRSAIDISDQYFAGDYWMSADGLQWFDEYDGQRVAILDDFRGKHCSFSFLLRLLDRHSLRVPFKGGYVQWTPELIFITCPYSPDTVFEVRGKHMPEDLQQLVRRITKVIEIMPGVSHNFIMNAIKAQLELPFAPSEIIDIPDDLDPAADLVLAPAPRADDLSPSMVIEDNSQVINLEEVEESDGESLETWLTKNNSSNQ